MAVLTLKSCLIPSEFPFHARWEFLCKISLWVMKSLLSEGHTYKYPGGCTLADGKIPQSGILPP